MARTFPTPNYATLTQLNGTTKRKLSVTSPGTTDSLATKGPAVTVTASQAYYLSPEALAVAGALNAVGTAAGIGWGLVPSDPSTLIPLSTDGFALSAGAFTVAVVATRDTALTSADQTCTFTAILFRANANATTFYAELGRQVSASVTMTTTKTSFPISITTVAAAFNPGDILWLEVYASTAATSTTGSTASYSTNSNTGVAVTSTTATYSTNYVKALADTASISDSLTRAGTTFRTLADSAPVSDNVARAASFPRALAESVPISDALIRVYTANRKLTDTLAISDSVVRSVTVSRALTESVPVADTLGKATNYTRALADVLGTVSTRFYPVLIFEE